ncbi:MAG: Gfo/Idh/MocA family oxidoreductase [Acidimicrobiia bacterium]|jgi:predicted dehydrogenase
MTDVTRLAVVGAGTMGSLYARAANSQLARGWVKCVGVVDSDLEAARRLGDELSVPAFDSLSAMVAACAPDAVYIAIPDDLHPAPFIEAASAGLAILVEKPLATTLADARRMADAARENGIFATVNFSNHWHPAFRAAHERIGSGDIGTVECINARLNNVIAVPRDWIGWSARTSPAWFLMSHCLDLAAWLSDQKAISVTAQSGGTTLRAAGIDVPDYVHALVRYDGGASALFESLWFLPEESPSPVDVKFQVVGEHGVIRVDSESQMISMVAPPRGLEYPPTQGWVLDSLVAFTAAAAERPVRTDGLEAGLANTATLVAINEAAATGERCEVRLEEPA